MQDRRRQLDEIFLQRTAGPYIWVRLGSRESFVESPLYPAHRTSIGSCKNHDLCTECLTLILQRFMLCIIYVRNGG
jgi:hypothetical protein